MIVTFDAKRVATLLELAKNAKVRKASYAQTSDPSLWRDDLDPELRKKMLEEIHENGYSFKAGHEHVDPAKIPAGLWLVGDEGIYLMPNCDLPQELINAGEHIAMARETDAKILGSQEEAHMAKLSIYGGDDGVDFLPAAGIAPYLQGEILELDITPEGIMLLLPEPGLNTPESGRGPEL